MEKRGALVVVKPRFRRKSFDYARQLFARAIVIDPQYALAYAGVADCCSFLYLWWDASDDTMFASTAAGLENTIATVNNLAAQLNVAIPGLNNNDAAIVGSVGSSGASLVDQINANIVNPVNANVNEDNSLVSFLNSTVLGAFIINGDTTNTINNRLNYTQSPLGLLANIAQTGISFGYVSAVSGASVAVTPVPWTAVPPVTVNNAAWIPIGSSTPVTVTPAEQQAIMNGIAARTNQLAGIKNQKIGEVRALTTIAAVIAYDVTAGWPPYTPPPGYVLEAPVIPPAGGVTLAGAPVVVSGVPEAPSDGTTYGRLNQTWTPALALTGNTLDGGSF